MKQLSLSPRLNQKIIKRLTHAGNWRPASIEIWTAADCQKHAKDIIPQTSCLENAKACLAQLGYELRLHPPFYTSSVRPPLDVETAATQNPV